MTRVTRRGFVSAAVGAAGAGLITPLADSLTAPAEAATIIPARPFGRTGAGVTMVGFGAGSRFYETIRDDAQAADLVRDAIERGIRYIETGSSYGAEGESERRIGLAMRSERSRVFLQTKIDSRDHDGAMRELDTSLKRLQTDHLDVVMHHNLASPEEIDRVAAPDGAESAIRRMVDQKVIRFRGFSSHDPAVTQAAIRRLEPQAIQVILNATRVPDFETDVLRLAREQGIAVVAMKAVGKGYFLPKNFTPPDRIEQYGPPPGVFTPGAPIPTARDYLRYTLSLSVSTVVVGIDSRQTLEAVERDVKRFTPYTPAEMAVISDRAQVFRTTGFWTPRSVRG